MECRTSGYRGQVTTFDLVPVPPEMADEVARRRAIGADAHDEVWDGEYRMAPAPRMINARVDVELAAALRPLARRRGLHVSSAFNLGVPRDHRVPDLGVHRSGLDRLWLPTAAIVVEVLSPRDTAWEKLPFYAAHEVDEVAMVDPDERSIAWLARHGDGYEPVARSGVLDVALAEVVAAIDWP
jgi:Uma2 family endonuclease